ncbi:hypothetical protein [Desulfosarcina ovata]|uniref:hypothetical protein n=1 Tax=Desulfosarcina ovata TaxID=83564 RepID=UPI0012D32799|nr:hypothetical protein [Desulfosarcina ovata]
MKIEKQYLQVSKVAHMMDWSSEYVHRLIREGKLVAICTSQRATRVSRESLMKLIAESKVNPENYFSKVFILWSFLII